MPATFCGRLVSSCRRSHGVRPIRSHSRALAPVTSGWSSKTSAMLAQNTRAGFPAACASRFRSAGRQHRQGWHERHSGPGAWPASQIAISVSGTCLPVAWHCCLVEEGDASRGLRRIARLPRHGRARDTPVGIGVAVTWTLILATVIAVVVAAAGWHFLHVKRFKPEPDLSATAAFNLLKVAFAVAAGAGAAVALVTSYRRQRFIEIAESREREGADREQGRLLNERFTIAASQLGHEAAAVRLAGVYAMASLADDWPQQRQTCADVLCAYLRMPYDPEPANDAPASERQAFHAEREVRHTVIRVITAHLQVNTARTATLGDWRDLDLDFTGVVFDGGSFTGAHFCADHVRFARAKFVGYVDFIETDFAGGTVSFAGARFEKLVRFAGTRFSGGRVTFSDARFADGTVNFARAEFAGGVVSFNHAWFVGGDVSFSRAKVSGGTVAFSQAMFIKGDVDFIDTEFAGGTVSFSDAKFEGSRLNFRRATFAGSTVTFPDTHFNGSNVDFGAASFVGSTVTFPGAKFRGGWVSFRQPQDWSRPPVFDGWEKPPPVVLLPRPVATTSPD